MTSTPATKRLTANSLIFFKVTQCGSLKWTNRKNLSTMSVERWFPKKTGFPETGWPVSSFSFRRGLIGVLCLLHESPHSRTRVKTHCYTWCDAAPGELQPDRR